MVRKIKNYIKERNLLPEDIPNSEIKIIIGLSGGADSVVLLDILHRLEYRCIAAHCNFHLREEESNRDEKAAEKIALSYNIPFFKKDFDTVKEAKNQQISIEMAARYLRYNWFDYLIKEQKANAIAVGHHQDDDIETFLLNLIRGTGIKGLTGIQPKNSNIIRPLLSVSKQEILEFARHNRLAYVTDSSNLQDEYTRNKIRLSLIPLLETINPSIHSSILRTMENLRETEKIYHNEVEQNIGKIFHPEKKTIDITKLKLIPSPEAVLFEILKEYGFNRDTIQNIAQAIDSQSGKKFHSNQFTLLKNRNEFILFPSKKESTENIIFIEKELSVIKHPIHLEMDVLPINNFKGIEKNKNNAYFDFDKLSFPLHLRKWKKGDKFKPFGMDNFQKLSDFFNNQKFSHIEKESCWLLCSEKNIIWIVGERTDNRYKVTETTRNIYQMKFF